MKPNKKGNFQEIGGLAVGITAFAIVIIIALLIASQTKDQSAKMGYSCDNSSYTFNTTSNRCCDAAGCGTGFSLLYNSTTTLQNATNTVPAWIPLIVLIVIGGILLMMVRRFGQ